MPINEFFATLQKSLALQNSEMTQLFQAEASSLLLLTLVAGEGAASQKTVDAVELC